MSDVQLSQGDIDSLAGKLDEFSAVLTDKEKALLQAIFGLAGTALGEASSEAEGGGARMAALATFSDARISLPTKLPSMSDAFRGSFRPGRVGRFDITASGGELASVSVGGSTVTWTA